MINPLIDQLELLSADYPLPDPTWDYAPLWKPVLTLQRYAQALTELLAQTEAASPESDRLVALYLTAMRDTATAALGESTSPPVLDQIQGGIDRVERDR